MAEPTKIGVVAGGTSGEFEVSMRSAAMIMDNVDRSLFDPYLMVINEEGWYAYLGEKRFKINKGDFSFGKGDDKVQVEGCFIIIHGSPGENGILQGYFKLIGMPHTTGDVFNMGLTFNKVATNNILRSSGFNTAKNMLIRRKDHYSSSEISMELGMPVFVKPNQGGSSIATSKVTAKEGLHSAIDLALEADDEVILEQFVEGTEVTCGVIRKDGEITPLPPTEIVPHTDFFDYEAKYSGKSDEITPARIGDGMTARIQELSVRIFDQLNCRGMIRVDYIIQDGVPHVVEVNTVPGFSPESIIPQQAEAAGISKKELISIVLESLTF